MHSSTMHGPRCRMLGGSKSYISRTASFRTARAQKRMRIGAAARPIVCEKV